MSQQPFTPDVGGMRPLGWAHVLIVTVVMTALVGIVSLTMDKIDDPGDIAAILATIVPGVAAVGAAVFGIPLAYHTGKAGKDEAVKQSRETMKHEVVNRIRAKLPAESELREMGGTAADAMTELRRELDAIQSST
jgi:hypothetical protein